MWVSQLSCIGKFSWISSKELDRGDSLCELSPLWHVFARRPRFQVQKATRCRRKRRTFKLLVFIQNPCSRSFGKLTFSNDFADHLQLGPLSHCLTPTLTSMTIWNIEGVKAEMLPTSFISALSRESIGLRGLSIDGRISREAVECVANIEGLRILKLFVNSWFELTLKN